MSTRKIKSQIKKKQDELRDLNVTLRAEENKKKLEHLKGCVGKWFRIERRYRRDYIRIDTIESNGTIRVTEVCPNTNVLGTGMEINRTNLYDDKAIKQMKPSNEVAIDIVKHVVKEGEIRSRNWLK